MISVVCAPFTDSTCSECGRVVAVGLQHAVQVCGTWKLWRECPACNERKDREAAEEKIRWQARVAEAEKRWAEERRVRRGA